MNFSLFFSLNTFQTISTLTAVIFLSFSTIRSQITSLKLYAILVSLFFLNLLLTVLRYETFGRAGCVPINRHRKLMRGSMLE